MVPSRYFLLLFAGILFLTSCTALQRASLWKKGRVVDLKETTVVPFSERWGMIFLEVELEGEPFNFLLDTGAPNVLDRRTAAALNKKPKAFGKVRDAYQRRARLDFTIVKNFGIGGLTFRNTGALIADFRSQELFDCMEIDGLIGSNLMQQAVWQIDFQEKEIRIAPSATAFDLRNARSLAFSHSTQGTPLVDVRIGSETMEDVRVDFGSGNGITTLRSKIPDSTLARAELVTLGTAGVGLYGPQQDTVHYLYHDSLRIAGQAIPPAVLRVRPLTEGLLGLRFWRQYLVTIDWQHNRLYFEPNGSGNLVRRSFGCGFEAAGDTIRVSSLWIPSPASEAGVQLGDQLLAYNGAFGAVVGFCTLLEALEQTETAELRLQRDGRIFSVALEKRDLFAPLYESRK